MAILNEEFCCVKETIRNYLAWGTECGREWPEPGPETKLGARWREDLNARIRGKINLSRLWGPEQPEQEVLGN